MTIGEGPKCQSCFLRIGILQVEGTTVVLFVSIGTRSTESDLSRNSFTYSHVNSLVVADQTVCDVRNTVFTLNRLTVNVVNRQTVAVKGKWNGKVTASQKEIDFECEFHASSTSCGFVFEGQVILWLSVNGRVKIRTKPFPSGCTGGKIEGSRSNVNHLSTSGRVLIGCIDPVELFARADWRLPWSDY